jgi:hypothetical protein
MILAELSGGVALRFQQFGYRRIFVRQSLFCCRQSDFQQSRPQRTLPGDERGAAGGAGLLSIVVGEDGALIADTIDVGRMVSHHAPVVGADVPVADVIGHDDQNIGLLRLLRHGRRARGYGCDQGKQAWVDVPCEAHRKFSPFSDCLEACDKSTCLIESPWGTRQKRLIGHAAAVGGVVVVPVGAGYARGDHNRCCIGRHDNRSGYITVWNAVAYAATVGTSVKAESAKAAHARDIRRRYRESRGSRKSLGAERNQGGRHPASQNHSYL